MWNVNFLADKRCIFCWKYAAECICNKKETSPSHFDKWKEENFFSSDIPQIYKEKILTKTFEDLKNFYNGPIRLCRKDGVHLSVTNDYRPERLNVGIVNGIVEEIFGWG
jgi:hypothetical protein